MHDEHFSVNNPEFFFISELSLGNALHKIKACSQYVNFCDLDKSKLNIYNFNEDLKETAQ